MTDKRVRLSRRLGRRPGILSSTFTTSFSSASCGRRASCRSESPTPTSWTSGSASSTGKWAACYSAGSCGGSSATGAAALGPLRSILLYSLANLANAAVHDVGSYAALRFVSGIGLAGELGAGVTLVSELLGRETRGYGTTLVCVDRDSRRDRRGVRVRGVRLAGGIRGGRRARDSPPRAAVQRPRISSLRGGQDDLGRAGQFFALFAKPKRLLRYLAAILVACPIWYVVGLLVTASPEFARRRALHMSRTPGGRLLWTYAGLVVAAWRADS